MKQRQRTKQTRKRASFFPVPVPQDQPSGLALFLGAEDEDDENLQLTASEWLQHPTFKELWILDATPGWETVQRYQAERITAAEMRRRLACCTLGNVERYLAGRGIVGVHQGTAVISQELADRMTARYGPPVRHINPDGTVTWEWTVSGEVRTVESVS